MRIHIFNVGHGSAALVVADNSNLLLLDCGHDDDGFRLSQYLPQRWKAIQELIVSHYDSDHVSGLADVAGKMPIETLFTNQTITVPEIRRLKQEEGPLTKGMETLLNMKSTFGPPGSATLPDLAGVTVQTFWHTYVRIPGIVRIPGQFQDMNNLSIVTFVEYRGFSVVFPGDLEEAGWLDHLRNPSFRQCLSRVKVFVASHHGRENGYCEEVFQYCKPELIVISDTVKQHQSQEHCYDRHATGRAFFRNGVNLGPRYVLTTRSDGHITIEKKVSPAAAFSAGLGFAPDQEYQVTLGSI